MDSNRTRALLRCGMVAGPFYLAVGLIQARLREGFDLARHPLSVLAVGPGGWIQTANFVITGLMVIAAAVGFGRALAWKPRALTWFLAGFGLCMIVAAIFPSDPMDGFPPGTPEGHPRRSARPGSSTSPRGARVRLPRDQLLHRRAGDVAPARAVIRLALASERPCRRARILRRHGVPVGNLGNLVRRGRGLGMARHHVGPAELGNAG